MPFPAPSAYPTAGAELVVTKGQLGAASYPLPSSLVFLGRAASCDIQLPHEDLDPLHCLISFGSAGFAVRDLETSGGTFVNGRRVTSCPLGAGDILSLGSVQFRMQLPVDFRPAAPQSELAAQRQALRVQAAAVASQQAALLEEEARLSQQQAAWMRQQEQLSAHLERLAGDLNDQRLRLVEHWQRLAREIDAWRAEYEAAAVELQARVVAQPSRLCA
jgi:FHA domain